MNRPAYSDSNRAYRQSVSPQDRETAYRVVVEESDLWIVASSDLREAIALELTRLRADLRAWILLHPEFRASLVPLPEPELAPDIVLRMYRAASIAGVGPFAAVAGAVAQMITERFCRESPEIIVENGGDTYMYSSRERRVGLLVDPTGQALLSVLVKPGEFPVSFCASSARIGHSLSLGNADLVVVRSTDGALADACATALANRLQQAGDIPEMIRYAQTLPIDGLFAQCDGKIALWGKMELC